jgi:tetratricopeptide (TPR) repeat protein
MLSCRGPVEVLSYLGTMPCRGERVAREAAKHADCWATLGQSKRAIEHFEAVLPTLPAVYRRDRGVAYGRLARAYASTGQAEKAAHLGREALAIARSSGSTRTEQTVAQLGRQLARHQRLAPVAELLDELGTA